MTTDSFRSDFIILTFIVILGLFGIAHRYERVIEEYRTAAHPQATLSWR